MTSIFTKIERAIDRRPLDEIKFREVLKRTGFKPGAVVMVHTSMDELAKRAPAITVCAIVESMKDLVTPGGTILMPAFQMDAVAEEFRLSPGTHVSIHPTHPVAAWGKHRALISTHHFGGTFDTFSPFYKLREHAGRVVGIGAGFDSFTVLHVAEELHSATRQRVFEREVRTINLVEKTETFEYAYRPLRANVTRDYERLEKALLQDGILRCSNEGGLKCAVMEVDAFLRRSKDFLDKAQISR